MFIVYRNDRIKQASRLHLVFIALTVLFSLVFAKQSVFAQTGEMNTNGLRLKERGQDQVSQVQQSEKLGFLNFGLGLSHVPKIENDFNTASNEKVDFDNQPSAYFELGRSIVFGPELEMLAVAGFEYGFAAKLNRKTSDDTGIVREKYTVRRTTVFGAFGTKLEVTPKIDTRLLARLGYSDLGLNSDHREDNRMPFYSFGPEIQLNYAYSNNVEFQLMGNYMIHYGDSNYLDFDNFTSMTLGAGISMPLELP